jgi:single-stranded DNA-binding protein
MGSNRFQLTGNVDREGVVTKRADRLGYVDVAVNASWRGEGGEMRERTDWFRVTLWGRCLADAAPMQKGSRVCIEGAHPPERVGGQGKRREGRGYEFVARRVTAL